MPFLKERRFPKGGAFVVGTPPSGEGFFFSSAAFRSSGRLADASCLYTRENVKRLHLYNYPVQEAQAEYRMGYTYI